LNDVIILAVSLAIILAGAELFTNGVEWLGVRLRFSEGAVGSILAAVGTALPETLIPVIAIVMGNGEAAEEIGIGAILGAPFMLGTLAFFLAGAFAMYYRRRESERRAMAVDVEVMRRDLFFFLLVYTGAIAASFLPLRPLKLAVGGVLVVAYLTYVYFTITRGQGMGEAARPDLLYLWRGSSKPPTPIILLQVFLALGGILGGARLFVGSVENLALLFGVPAFVLSVIVAPVATELPEKFNSILWIRNGKDTLALGNITGAMVFQSSLIPALGIALTPWSLTPLAVTSAVLALVSALIVYLNLLVKKSMSPTVLVWGGLFYAVFLFTVLVEQTGDERLYALLIPVSLGIYLVNRAYMRRAVFSR